MLRTRLFQLLLIIIFCTYPFAVGALELTLEQAIDLALAEGYEARTLHLQLQQAEEDQAAVTGRTATQVDLFIDSPNFAKQVQSVRLPDQLPSYNTVGSLQWRGQLQISKPFVATNTTVTRPTDASKAYEGGGLSGAPLFDLASSRIQLVLEAARGRVPVIGVGGVDSPDRAKTLLNMGCSAVELYTGLVFSGPGLVGRINRSLNDDA